MYIKKFSSVLLKSLSVFGLFLLTSPVHALGGSFVDDFNTFDYNRWHKADGWSNGSVFNCGWRADHVTFGSGVMTLQLDNATCRSGCSDKDYASGEYRTTDSYHYGRYDVWMKAAKGSGIVSSFFIYNPSPWDEIDIEILGKNTWQMQTNFYTNGVGGNEAVINLGFDASLAFHKYSIIWQPGYIEWYVDDVKVHTEAGSGLPAVAGRIMMNLWPGIGVDSWLGPFNYTSPLTAQYTKVQYTAY